MMKMKRTIAMLCAGVLACTGAAALVSDVMQDAAITAFAAVSVYDGVKYRIEDDHAAVIGHTDDLPAEVTLPAEIDGKPVTEICRSAFYERVGLKSITLPDSITVIGENAFDGCSQMTSLTIPDSVTSIGD